MNFIFVLTFCVHNDGKSYSLVFTNHHTINNLKLSPKIGDLRMFCKVRYMSR